MVSPRKTKSAMNLIREEGHRLPTTTKSCESLYSAVSSKESASNVYSRKQGGSSVGSRNGSLCGDRQGSIIPATTEVRQRVLSARRLRMKTFQNQLMDAQQTITELQHENRMLRTLHKRQDTALAKYENSNAELPKLLHSHSEELRVWQVKFRNVHGINKELEQKLKQREATILTLSDQNKFLSQLNLDKSLEERQILTEKLQAMEQRLKEKDNDLKSLTRKMQINAKNFQQQLGNEQKKMRDAMGKLERARMELSSYHKLDEMTNVSEKINMQKQRKTIPLEDNNKPNLDKIAGATEMSTTDDTDYMLLGRENISAKRSIRKGKIERTDIKPVPEPPIPERRIDIGGGDATSMPIITQKKPKKKPTKLPKKLPKNVVTPKKTIKKVIEKQEEDTDLESKCPKISDDEYDIGVFNSNIDLDLCKEVENLSFKSDCDTNGTEDEYDGDKTSRNETDDSDQIEDVLAHKSAHLKKEISNIRKQISDDYKDREAFLETFCRQTNSSDREDTQPQKHTVSVRTLPSTRKQNLLAALKAIDDNKSLD